MFITTRAIVALCLSALLLGSASVPASAAAVGVAPQLVQPAAVSVPYGSGPIVINPLDTAVKLPGQDILPGDNMNGVFALNNAVTGYGWGETDASGIAPAFVKNLEQPGDFVGQINLIEAGADIYTLHQKNRLVVIVLPYDGFSGTLKLAYSGQIVQGVQPVYTFNSVPITVTVQDPTIKAADDFVSGPGVCCGLNYSGPEGSLTAHGPLLTIPDILANDTANYPGRSQSVFFGSKDTTMVQIPEGLVMLGQFNSATFTPYDSNFTGKVTVPYTVCSSYKINPRGFIDIFLAINRSTSEVCSTALLTFDIPPVVPDVPTVPTIPETPVIPTTPERPVVPTTPETPVVPVPAPENPAPVVPVPEVPVAPVVPAPVAAAPAKLHIADGSAAAPVAAVSPAVPFPVVFGVAALVMVIFAAGLIAVGRMRRK